MSAHRPGSDRDATPPTARCAFPALGRSAGEAPDAANGEGVPGTALRWPPDGVAAPHLGARGVTAPTVPAAPGGDSRQWAGWPPADLRGDELRARCRTTGHAGAPAGLSGRLAPEWSASGTSRRVCLRRARDRTDGGVTVPKAVLDRGDELAREEAVPQQAPSERPESSYRRSPAAGAGQTAAHWRGAGGRWLIWVARVVVWAVILLVGYRGVVAIAGGSSTGGHGSSPARAVTATRFPVTAAEAYALEFGDVYLNYSPAMAAERSAALAAFLPPGASPQLGWNGAGTQQLLAEQVAGITVRSGHSAVVTLLARLADGSLVELDVPVYSAGSGMSVPGEPALLPGPAKAAPPADGQAGGDQVVAAALQSQLGGFFQAYASGDEATLARFLTPGAQITGLGGLVRFGGIDAVYAPAGGATRTISVTVSWLLPSQPAPRSAGATAAAPGGLQMTYELTVVKRGGSWDVRSIGAATQPLTQGPP
jgi:hypothetical protein